MSYLNQQFEKAINKGTAANKRKTKVRKLTTEEKIPLIKEAFGLTHGGTKQNKKRRVKRKKRGK